MDLREIQRLYESLEHVYWLFKDLEEPGATDETEYSRLYDIMDEILGPAQF